MTIRRRYHPTTSFALFAGVTVLLGIGAINSQNNLLFFCFGAALAALLLSGFVSGSALMRVRLRRVSIGEAFVNAPLRIVYEVEHLGRGLPAFALHIEERKGAFLGVERATWPRFMRRPTTFLPFVGRGKSAHAEAVVTPSRRGRATLTEARLVTTFPFGAIKKSVSFIPGDDGEGRTEILVRPEVVALPSALARRVAQASRDAERASKHLGRGDEFFGLREYAPGDSVRRIAWRSTARLGELVVREDAASDSSRMVVVLRLSRSKADTARDARDEHALSLAASVILRTARDGAGVGLAVPADALYHDPGAGDAHVAAMLDALAKIDLGSPSLTRDRLEEARTRRDAMVVIDADALDEAPDTLISADRALA